MCACQIHQPDSWHTNECRSGWLKSHQIRHYVSMYICVKCEENTLVAVKTNMIFTRQECSVKPSFEEFSRETLWMLRICKSLPDFCKTLSRSIFSLEIKFGAERLVFSMALNSVRKVSLPLLLLMCYMQVHSI